MLRRIQAGLLQVLVIVTAVFGVQIITSEASWAACTGSGCNGRNPDTEGCSERGLSTPFEAFYDNRYTLQLRKSSGCNAQWARIVRDEPASVCGIMHIRVEESEYRNVDGERHWVTIRAHNTAARTGNCNGGISWSKMVPNVGSHRYRACYAIRTNAPPAGSDSWSCGRWVNG